MSAGREQHTIDMDEIHGSLLNQAEKVIDLLFTKYLKAEISYEGVTRVETYPYPKPAIREAVYNAIVHKNYAAQIPIQISVYRDKLYISNDCILPAGWTVETLMQKHRSKPFNPNIANGFFRASFIETWGRGIEKICAACRKHRNPLPEYTVYPENITVMFRCRQWERITAVREATYILEHEYRQNTDMNTVSDKKTAEKVLAFLKLNPEATQKEISERLHITQRTTERAIAALKEQKRIIRIGNNRTGHWIVMDNGS